MCKYHENIKKAQKEYIFVKILSIISEMPKNLILADRERRHRSRSRERRDRRRSRSRDRENYRRRR